MCCKIPNDLREKSKWNSTLCRSLRRHDLQCSAAPARPVHLILRNEYPKQNLEVSSKTERRCIDKLIAAEAKLSMQLHVGSTVLKHGIHDRRPSEKRGAKASLFLSSKLRNLTVRLDCPRAQSHLSAFGKLTVPPIAEPHCKRGAIKARTELRESRWLVRALPSVPVSQAPYSAELSVMLGQQLSSFTDRDTASWQSPFQRHPRRSLFISAN